MAYDVCFDTLTGLPNLFGLLKSDPNFVLGSQGTVFFVDMIQLSRINQENGRDVGDRYVTNLVDLLNQYLHRDFSAYEAAIKAYKYAGNLLIIFTGVPHLDMAEIGKKIHGELSQRMALLGAERTGIFYGFWTYLEPYKSMSAFLKNCQMRMEPFYGHEMPGELPKWADFLMDKLYEHINTTVSEIQRIAMLAHHDAISGINNHLAAEDYLNELFGSQGNFSVLFIDGDNLKRYNELSYQHGNDMIRKLAQSIGEAVRKEDHVYRWLSGDEFIVVLNNTDKDSAMDLAERVRAHIETELCNLIYPVTISIGVSSYPDDGETLDEVLRRAEEANAQAKKSGKNSVA